MKIEKLQIQSFKDALPQKIEVKKDGVGLDIADKAVLGSSSSVGGDIKSRIIEMKKDVSKPQVVTWTGGASAAPLDLKVEKGETESRISGGANYTPWDVKIKKGAEHEISGGANLWPVGIKMTYDADKAKLSGGASGAPWGVDVEKTGNTLTIKGGANGLPIFLKAVKEGDSTLVTGGASGFPLQLLFKETNDGTQVTGGASGAPWGAKISGSFDMTDFRNPEDLVLFLLLLK